MSSISRSGRLPLLSAERGFRVSRRALSRAASVLRRAFAVALAALASAGAAQAQYGPIEGYHFTVRDTVGFRGFGVTLTVVGAHEKSAQGFSLGMRYPVEDLSVERVHFEDTILDAIGTDFFQVFVNAEEAYLTVGCLVDAQAPFEGNLIPYVGMALPFFYVEGRLDEDASDEVVVEFAGGLGIPPVYNLYVVDDLPQAATELVSGTITVRDPPVFLRGDANLDARIDVSDAVFVLDYLFRGGPEPGCQDAADINDDWLIDLSDPIHLLMFLFLGTADIPPPRDEPGPDLTEDFLGCEQSLI